MFELNGTTLAALGGIMGVMSGAIGFLMRKLLESKDSEIKRLVDRLTERELELTKDRDYWRDFSMRQLETNDKVVEIQEKQARTNIRRAS